MEGRLYRDKRHKAKHITLFDKSFMPGPYTMVERMNRKYDEEYRKTPEGRAYLDALCSVRDEMKRRGMNTVPPRKLDSFEALKKKELDLIISGFNEVEGVRIKISGRKPELARELKNWISVKDRPRFFEGLQQIDEEEFERYASTWMENHGPHIE